MDATRTITPLLNRSIGVATPPAARGAAARAAGRVPTEKGAHTPAFSSADDRVYAFLPRTHRAAVYQEQEDREGIRHVVLTERVHSKRRRKK